jgi:flagellar biosynthesis GTPase FlhF
MMTRTERQVIKAINDFCRVPVGVYDNGEVPDQFEVKDSPLLRVPMYTQQGERTYGHATPAQIQRELSNMQDQINVMQEQLQHQTPQFPVSPQLPGSPMYPHVVPREYGHIQNQQVPLSPQHPQINFGSSHQGASSLHRNIVTQQIRQHLAPPQPSFQQHLQPQSQRHAQPQQPQNAHNAQNPQNPQNSQLQQHFNQQQQAHQQRLHQQPEHVTFGEQVVRKDPMMSYLMDSLNVVCRDSLLLHFLFPLYCILFILFYFIFIII